MAIPKEPLLQENENKELNKVLDKFTGPTKEEAAGSRRILEDRHAVHTERTVRRCRVTYRIENIAIV